MCTLPTGDRYIHPYTDFGFKKLFGTGRCVVMHDAPSFLFISIQIG